MKKSFHEILEEYKSLPFVERQLVRQAAVDSLKEAGSWEIGSSDVNHEIASLYKRYESFDLVLEAYYP